MLENILARVATHDAAHGFVPTRSTVSNATPHVGRDVVVNADLKDFFPTITFPRVKGVFQGLGFSPAAATILGLLCTESPRRELEYDGQRLFAAVGPRALPQGACTSPALSNLAARNLDARLGDERDLLHRVGQAPHRTGQFHALQIGHLAQRVQRVAGCRLGAIARNQPAPLAEPPDGGE